MSVATIFLVVIGLPLILIAIGFVVLVVKAFSGPDDRAQRAQTLETARGLERALSALETRLTALEDIILTANPDRKKGGEPHD